MAQHGPSTALRLCRACRYQIQKSTSSSTRSFSSTTSSKASLPAFQPTSSEELNTLLSTLRTKVFVPEVVNSTQRKLIYKPARQSILLGDPGVNFTTKEGEEIKLEPLNIHNRPKKKQTLYRILALMQENESWENLPALLQGLQASNQNPVKLAWWKKMVRKAGEAGRIDIIIRCAEMGDRTGLWFTQPEVVEEVVASLHNDAVAAQWTGEQFDTVIKDAEKMVRVLEGTTSAKKLKDGEKDYRKSPEVAGLLLELYSARAINEYENKDKGRLVLQHAQRLDALWDNGNYSIDKENPTFTLSWLIPTWNGMKKALEIDSLAKHEVKPRLQKRLQELEAVIDEARDACMAEANEKPRRGLNMYNALV